MLKTKYCNYLIEHNLVKDMDVIIHSYTSDRMSTIENGSGNKLVICNNISPTLTTRCDCLGVVVTDIKK